MTWWPWVFLLNPTVGIMLIYFLLWFTVNPSTCSSTGSDRWNSFFDKNIITLQPGSPCNDFKGYCDVFMKCRLVDADGPLARLKKAIFNAELYENIAEWIVVSEPNQYWMCTLFSYSLELTLKTGLMVNSITQLVLHLLHLLDVISYSGSLVGSAVDGYCSYYANGWLHQDLQCTHSQQQPQTAPTKTTARYSISMFLQHRKKRP